MKKQYKIILVLASIALVFAMSGCNNEASNGNLPNQPATASDAEITTAEDIDVDLTVMSSAMVFDEVKKIMNSPEQYLGKTIKMSGEYSPVYYDYTEKFYHYVLIHDAVDCCEQGIEFILLGDAIYPLDYPKEKSQVEVVGVFCSYDELESTYYYIETDNIITLST